MNAKPRQPERGEESATRAFARRAALVALVALVSTLGACSWFTDFKDQPRPDPWESPDSIPMRGNPQNSVSIYGSAVPGFAVSRAMLPGTLDSMSAVPNPSPADPRSLSNGRKYYAINCAVCHGDAGKADGPVTKYGLYVPPLVGPSAEGRTDGYIWGIMRNGRGGMPSYNRIEELDRWDVVNYVRGLQGRVQVVTGPVGLPGETGDKLPGPSEMGPTRPSPHRAGAWRTTVAPAARADSVPMAPVDSAVPASTTPDSLKMPTTGGER